MDSDGDLLAEGLPHSDTHGSKPARGSPWLFAACHVLHRLLVPRHPPNALLALETGGTRRIRPVTHRNQPRRPFPSRVSRHAHSPLPLVAPERIRGGRQPHGNRSPYDRSDRLTAARPGAHPNQIHTDKDPDTAMPRSRSTPIMFPPSHGAGPGDYRDRTDDLLLAKQALSQLS
jgi:hypothetical protein